MICNANIAPDANGDWDASQKNGFVLAPFPAAEEEENRGPNCFDCKKPCTAAAMKGAINQPEFPAPVVELPPRSERHVCIPYASWLTRLRRRTAASSSSSLPVLDVLVETTAKEGYPHPDDLYSTIPTVESYRLLRSLLMLPSSALIRQSVEYLIRMCELDVTSPLRKKQCQLEQDAEACQIADRLEGATAQFMTPAKKTPLEKVNWLALADTQTEACWNAIRDRTGLAYELRFPFEMAFGQSILLRRRGIHTPARLPAQWIWSCFSHMTDINSTWSCLTRCYVLLVLSQAFLPLDLFSSDNGRISTFVILDSLLCGILWSYQNGSPSGLLRCIVSSSAVVSIISLRPMDWDKAMAMSAPQLAKLTPLLDSIMTKLLNPCINDSAVQRFLQGHMRQLMGLLRHPPPPLGPAPPASSSPPSEAKTMRSSLCPPSPIIHPIPPSHHLQPPPPPAYSHPPHSQPHLQHPQPARQALYPPLPPRPLASAAVVTALARTAVQKVLAPPSLLTLPSLPSLPPPPSIAPSSRPQAPPPQSTAPLTAPPVRLSSAPSVPVPVEEKKVAPKKEKEVLMVPVDFLREAKLVWTPLPVTTNKYVIRTDTVKNGKSGVVRVPVLFHKCDVLFSVIPDFLHQLLYGVEDDSSLHKALYGPPASGQSFFALLLQLTRPLQRQMQDPAQVQDKAAVSSPKIKKQEEEQQQDLPFVLLQIEVIPAGTSTAIPLGTLQEAFDEKHFGYVFATLCMSVIFLLETVPIPTLAVSDRRSHQRHLCTYAQRILTQEQE